MCCLGTLASFLSLINYSISFSRECQDMPDGELQIKARDMQCHSSIVTRYLSLLKQIYTWAESSCRVTLSQMAVSSQGDLRCDARSRVFIRKKSSHCREQKMSGYKLYYFTGRVGGEIVRLSFAAANIEFEDIRLEGEAWAKEKACR